MADLIEAQHTAEVHVLSTVHVHMTRSHCLEVITLKGSKESITKLTNKITGISGIEYAKLFTFSLPDDDLLEHSHHH
jgi:metal-responsive CopG/Arc/MetJ family transcriptional regulator